MINHSELSKSNSESGKNAQTFQVLVLNNNPVDINISATLSAFSRYKGKMKRHGRTEKWTTWNQSRQTRNTVVRKSNKSFIFLIVGRIHDRCLVQVSMIIFSLTFYLIVYHAQMIIIIIIFVLYMKNDENRNSSYFFNDDLSKFHQITNQSQEFMAQGKL